MAGSSGSATLSLMREVEERAMFFREDPETIRNIYGPARPAQSESEIAWNQRRVLIDGNVTTITVNLPHLLDNLLATSTTTSDEEDTSDDDNDNEREGEQEEEEDDGQLPKEKTEILRLCIEDAAEWSDPITQRSSSNLAFCSQYLKRINDQISRESFLAFYESLDGTAIANIAYMALYAPVDDGISAKFQSLWERLLSNIVH